MPALCRDGVLENQRVARNDRHHHPDWPLSRRVAGPDVLGNRRPCRYLESGYLIGRGHASDDLINAVDLLVPGFLEDVLTRGVLRLG